jgi:thymus-specific serine protease
MHDVGADLNAVFFGFEMRFFGRNRPTNDLTTPNLRFLSTEQVLADLANMIDHVRQQDLRLANARIILTGTMFGGNLATWFRVKYPHLVDGVWSSSSHVDARMNFGEYYEAIGEDLLAFGNEECYRRVWRAFGTMENLIDGGRSEVLDDMFNLCHPINVTSHLEVARFFEGIVESVVVGIMNGGYEYIDAMCVSVTNSSVTNDLIAFSEWFKAYRRSPNCFGMNFQEVVDFLTTTDWNALAVVSGRRQFHYLTCTEYGWFTTTDLDNQPFGSRITESYFIEMCRQVFGDWVSENMREHIAKTNLSLGGHKPVITDTFFTNGGMDPHRVINVQNNIGSSVEARTLPCESP